jgi:hypothetical protein
MGKSMKLCRSLLFLLLLVLLSCGPEKSQIKCKDCAITISAANSAIFTTVDTDNALPNTCPTLLGDDLDTTNNPSGTFSSTAPITTGLIAVSGAPIVSGVSTSDLVTDSSAEIVDTADNSQVIAFDNDFPNLGQTCSVSIPTVSLNCFSTSFTVTNSDVSGISGNSVKINMDATKFDGFPTNYESNSVSFTRLYIKQVSDLDTEVATEVDLNDDIDEMFTFNSELYFIGGAANGLSCDIDANEKKLHRIEGSSIRAISNSRSDGNDFESFPIKKITFNDKLYLEMRTGAGMRNLFAFDTVPAVDTLVGLHYFDSTNTDMNISSLAQFGTKLYFFANESTLSPNQKLFSLDSSNNIVLLGSTSSDGADALRDDNNTTMFTFNGNLYFDGDAAASGLQKLFKLVSPSPRVSQVTNLFAGGNDFDDSKLNYIEFNSKIYLVAEQSAGIKKIYTFDGSTIVSFSNTAGSLLSDEPANFYIYNNELYFTAEDLNANIYLYKTNGTTINRVKPTSSDDGNDDDESDSPSDLYVFNDELYYASNLSTGNRKLFKTNGSNVTQVSDISATNDNPTDLLEFNDELYFVAEPSAGNKKLYKYDGSKIYQLTNYNNGGNDDVNIHIEFNDELYFTMTNGTAKKLFKVTETP